jgi:hypothetical protein
VLARWTIVVARVYDVNAAADASATKLGLLAWAATGILPRRFDDPTAGMKRRSSTVAGSPPLITLKFTDG